MPSSTQLSTKLLVCAISPAPAPPSASTPMIGQSSEDGVPRGSLRFSKNSSHFPDAPRADRFDSHFVIDERRLLALGEFAHPPKVFDTLAKPLTECQIGAIMRQPPNPFCAIGRRQTRLETFKQTYITV